MRKAKESIGARRKTAASKAPSPTKRRSKSSAAKSSAAKTSAKLSGRATPSPTPARSKPRAPSRSSRPPAAGGPTRRAKTAPADPGRRSRPQVPASAEEILQRAMAARTPRARGIWARRGLALRSPIDRTTQSMLMRQLYLSYYEDRRFDKALSVAEQVIELVVLPDVAHQDAARASQALGDIEGAAGHLRLAARVSPAKRKAFHWWTLGSLYHLAGRHEEAKSALTRAARWGTTDKPLYQGHLAIVRCASGESVEDLSTLIDRLAEAPAGQGYGRFVLGHLAYYAGRPGDARRYLEAFVKRSESGRLALAIALGGEIALARSTLAALDRQAASGGAA